MGTTVHKTTRIAQGTDLEIKPAIFREKRREEKKVFGLLLGSSLGVLYSGMSKYGVSRIRST